MKRTARVPTLAALSALSLPCVLTAVLTAGPAQAAPAVVDVSTLSAIDTAWSAGNTARLVADVTAPAGVGLVARDGGSVLDLNGHSLTIPSGPDNYAALTVPVSRSATVRDSAGGGALVLTGGRGGPGLGGASANWSHKDCGTVLVQGAHVVATGGAGFASGSTTYGAGAGIGSGGASGGATTTGHGCALTVDGGWVQATGGRDLDASAAPAIGSGNGVGSSGATGAPGTVAITGTGTTGPLAAGFDTSTTGRAGVAPTATVTPGGTPFTATSVNGSASVAATVTIRTAHVITYDTAGGSALAPETVPFGAVATAGAPTRSGYTFAGWSTGAAGGPAWDPATPVTASSTVVAAWTPVPVVNPPVPTPSGPAARGGVVLAAVAGDTAAGRTVTIATSSLAPGSAWILTMHSAPVVLASGMVPADGTVSTTAALPSSVPAGSHRVELTATGADGQPYTTASWFRVAADGTVVGVSSTGPVPDVLAATGVGDAVPLTVLGGLLVLAGGGALVATRRRVG
ncbi:InlB B-repeat-containing protein [Klenkia marina]|uniref:InlB B-repeat-containing protein n=1 Tax=Klenkia marina TaxID=1960309 RepID=UPI001402A1CF|nr:InlB B-repeat-containing protein [Klenkia marina]